MKHIPSFAQRIEIARRLIAALFEDFNATVSAIVADGWPEEMVRAGLSFHRQTWDIDEFVEHIQRELYAFGGLAALEGFAHGGDVTHRYHITRPRHVIHIWPALPGAGLSPVLFGWLLGIKQTIRPSSRCTYFAHHFYEIWEDLAGSALVHLEFGAPDTSWQNADVIVVSGRDETVDAVREFVGTNEQGHAPTLLGYGHRISFATIVDHPSIDIERCCRNIALDTVLWHQMGCFSSRGVIFCGSTDRATRFAQTLGTQLQHTEQTLQATTLPQSNIVQRAQARGSAEFTGQVFGEGFGWVHQVNGAFVDHQNPPHVLTFHRIDNIHQLEEAVAVQPRHLQGVALACAPDQPVIHQTWARALARLGATRVCEPGQLQSPPASWCHDGWANVLMWLRVCTMD